MSSVIIGGLIWEVVFLTAWPLLYWCKKILSHSCVFNSCIKPWGCHLMFVFMCHPCVCNIQISLAMFPLRRHLHRPFCHQRTHSDQLFSGCVRNWGGGRESCVHGTEPCTVGPKTREYFASQLFHCLFLEGGNKLMSGIWWNNECRYINWTLICIQLSLMTKASSDLGKG